MAVHKPLVVINGTIQQLPDGDTIEGGGGGGGTAEAHPGLESGRLFGGVASDYGVTNITVNRYKYYVCALRVPEQTTFDAIEFSVTVGYPGDASSEALVGIYTTENGYPADLIVEAGPIDISTVGDKSAAINETLDPGWYWTVIQHNSVTGIRLQAMAVSGSQMVEFMGRNSFTSSGTITIEKSEIYSGSLPLDIRGGWGRAAYNLPLILLQKA